MLKIIAAVAVGLCSLSVAFAQDGENRVKTLFDLLDSNQDGLLTRNELQENEQQVRLFERLLNLSDENEDGQLTKEEYLEGLSPDRPAADEAERPGPPPRGRRQPLSDPKAIFSRLDQNGNKDGKLQLEELPRPLQERLGPAYTTLGKDSMTEDEFATAFRVLFAESPQPAGLPATEAFFEHFDKNKDDKVTLDEIPEQFRPRLKELFERLDAEFMTKDDYARMVERSRRPRPEAAPADRPESQRNAARGVDRNRPGFMRRPAGEDGQRRGPAFFAMLDEDRDGKLSTSELSQASQLVARLDRNEDDLLDPAELFGFGRGQVDRPGRGGPGRGRPDTAERTAERPDRPQRPPLEEEPKPEEEKPKATAGTPQPETPQASRGPRSIRTASNSEFAERYFVRYDENQDDKLSSEEAPDRLRQRFDRLDLDGDGSVSKQELKKALENRSR